MNFIEQNWQLISSHPWVFASFALLFLTIGWGGAKIIYAERIERLKLDLEDARRPAGLVAASGTTFSYPATGRHGRNLLSNSTHSAHVNESFSLRAEVPSGSKLHLVLKLRHTSNEVPVSWDFSVMGVVNWVNGPYEGTQRATVQHFDAEGGLAELKLNLRRAGELEIAAYEASNQTPTWCRTVQIKP